MLSGELKKCLICTPLLVVLHLPEVLHDFVHWPSVGELHLESHSLTGHLDVDEDVKHRRNDFKSEVMNHIL